MIASRTVAAAALALAVGLPASIVAQPGTPPVLAAARQLVLVTSGGWDSTTAVLRRYERAVPNAPWRPVGDAVPVVLGRTGLAWGVGQGAAPAGAPVKREGDGRSPAGVYPLLHAFGDSAHAAPLAPALAPVLLAADPVCVDDAASPLYNAVVDSAGAGGARWASAERMREVAGYRLGLVVGYNGAWTRAAAVRAGPAGGRPPVRGRGSCIFLHVWDGPTRPTAGCTAMAEPVLAALLGWIDPARSPALVQLPAGELGRRRGRWQLP